MQKNYSCFTENTEMTEQTEETSEDIQPRGNYLAYLAAQN